MLFVSVSFRSYVFSYKITMLKRILTTKSFRLPSKLCLFLSSTKWLLTKTSISTTFPSPFGVMSFLIDGLYKYWWIGWKSGFPSPFGVMSFLIYLYCRSMQYIECILFPSPFGVVSFLMKLNTETIKTSIQEVSVSFRSYVFSYMFEKQVIQNYGKNVSVSFWSCVFSYKNMIL